MSLLHREGSGGLEGGEGGEGEGRARCEGRRGSRG